jgi:hypothetical protein
MFDRLFQHSLLNKSHVFAQDAAWPRGLILQHLLNATIDVEKDEEGGNDERLEQLGVAEASVKGNRVAKAVDERVATVERDALKQVDHDGCVFHEFPKRVQRERSLGVARHGAAKQGAPCGVGHAPCVKRVL